MAVLASLCRSVLLGVCLVLFANGSNAESNSETRVDTGAWDWDLFDYSGWTPRYTYLYKDNLLGIAHYGGLSYFNKDGANAAGATFRYGKGKKGEKYNIAYTNGSFHWGVDFGFSWHVLNAENNGRRMEGIEQLGLELGIRYRMVTIVATHTEDYSWATLGFSLNGMPFFEY